MVENQAYSTKTILIFFFTGLGVLYFRHSNGQSSKHVIFSTLAFLFILLKRFFEKNFSLSAETGEQRRKIFERIEKEKSYSTDVFKSMLANFDIESKDVINKREFFVGANNVKLHIQKWSKFESDFDSIFSNINERENYKNKEKPRGVIFFVHGYSSSTLFHFGILCKALAAKNYIVYAMDGHGHGLSDGSLCYIPDFRQYVDDYFKAYKKISFQEKGLKKFLFGVSMGGAVALHLLEREREEGEKIFDAVILASPMVQLNRAVVPSKMTMRILEMLCYVCPRAKIIPTGMKGSCYQIKEVENAINEYPLTYKDKARLLTSAELYYACIDCEKMHSHVKIPLLAIHGENDTVTIPQSTKQFFSKIQSEDKKLILYPNQLHGIFFDSKAEEVFADIVFWLEEHTAVD